jgi:hypothetical protein
MTITYKDKTYELTTAQLQGLRYGAGTTSGAFSLERRNDATDEKLASLGLIEEDFSYREIEERGIKLANAMAQLEAALQAAKIGELEKAEEKSQDALLEFRDLNRTRFFLTEIGYGIVLQEFPMTVVMLPKRFAHLAPKTAAYYGLEVK